MHLSSWCTVIEWRTRIGHRSRVRQGGIMTGRSSKVLGAQAASHSTCLRHWSQRSIPYSPQTGVLTGTKQDKKEILDFYSVAYTTAYSILK